MKERILIKVIASFIQETNGRMVTTTARGISTLKRGWSISDFIFDFMTERKIEEYSLYQRTDDTWATSPIMSLDAEPRTIVTYHFVQFPVSELGFNAKDLSATELDRDMKKLKKVIHG